MENQLTRNSTTVPLQSIYKKCLGIVFASALVYCCMLGQSVSAATLVVTSLADTGPGTLRQQVAVAAPGDTITFRVRGTIFLTSRILIDKDLTILGHERGRQVIIDGQTTTLIFAIPPGVNVVIADLTLTNGYNAIFSPEGFGGAVQNLGNLAMVRCVITESSTEFADGGAIWSNGDLVVNQCSISNNTAIFGGGIAHRGTGTLVIDRSTINNNRSIDIAPGAGGGIASSGGTAFLTNSTISGNTAFNGNGGGLAGGPFIIESCTIASNRALAVTFENQGQGGGIASSQVDMRNTIVAGNTATNTVHPLAPQSIGPDIWGTVNSLGWNLIQNTNDAVIIGISMGNIIGVDPLLGTLRDNGGPTWTHALRPVNPGRRLVGPISPAIDAGSPFTFPPIDQRDVPRPQDGDGDGTAITDIGAYERIGHPPGRALRP